MVERWMQDVRYGFRILRKSPLYTFVAVLTLALGIGASTAIFSVVYGVLLQALPYYKSDQLVRMWEINSNGNKTLFADPNFEDIRSQSASLQGMAEMHSEEVTVSVGEEPDRARVANVSKDFFSVMGVQPVKGRLFAPEEQRFGAAATALVSYSYWKRHLHEAADLGSLKFTVSKNPTAVIGVLPPGFRFPDDSDIWMAREIFVRYPSRSAHNWAAIARLKDDASLHQAQSEAATLAHRIHEQFSAGDITMVDVAILPLRDALTAEVRPALLILFGVAGLLLLVACANVMNLSQAQASVRAGELAIRSALGASRGRLIRQFMAEAIVLCLLGGCLGVGAAYFGVRALLALAPANIPRLDEISVNLPALWFALGLSALVAISLGILTALRATSREVQSALAESGSRQGSSIGAQRAGRMIVAGQVAITLTLLVGAGLLGRSMLRVLTIHPGFESERVVTLDLHFPDLESQMEAQRVHFLDELIAQLQTLPGVQAVGGTNALPLKSDASDGTYALLNLQQIPASQRALVERAVQTSPNKADAAFLNEITKFLEGLFKDESRTGDADYIVASQGYFETLGIPLLSGRLFTGADGPEAPHVAIISESVARQRWPNHDAIGQTIEFGNMDGDLRLLTIVGIVADVRTRSLEKEPSPTIYVNYRQRPRATSQFSIVLRTTSDPATIFASGRQIVGRLDPAIPPRFSTFREVFSESLSSRRFNLLLVGTFGLAALLLAMAGVFGVLAYSVAQRTREIGVRIALGASAGSVFQMVLGQGLATTLIGAVFGIAGSLFLTRTMR